MWRSRAISNWWHNHSQMCVKLTCWKEFFHMCACEMTDSPRLNMPSAGIQASTRNKRSAFFHILYGTVLPRKMAQLTYRTSWMAPYHTNHVWVTEMPLTIKAFMHGRITHSTLYQWRMFRKREREREGAKIENFFWQLLPCATKHRKLFLPFSEVHLPFFPQIQQYSYTVLCSTH